MKFQKGVTVPTRFEKGSKFAYYTQFAKVQKEKQIVEGVASSEAIDSYGDIVRITAIKDALPDYMAFANLRAMHSNIAAGTVTKAEINEKDKLFWITAKVVDKGEWEKVVESVYKGFSIGGQIEEAEPLMVDVEDKDGNTHEVWTGGFEITKLKLVEISLVDRPANPEAMIDSYKSAKLMKNDSKDGEVDLKEAWVPDVCFKANFAALTEKGEKKHTVVAPSSIKRKSLLLLSPTAMKKSQLMKAAQASLEAALKKDGVLDADADELLTLSRSEIIEMAKEAADHASSGIASFLKAEGDDKADDEEDEEEDDEEKDEDEKEEDDTEEKDEKEEDKEEEEKDEKDEEEKDEKTEKVTKVTKKVTKSDVPAFDADAFAKAVSSAISKSLEPVVDSVKSLKKSQSNLVDAVKSLSKGASSQIEEDTEEEEDVPAPKTEKSERMKIRKAFSGDQWGERI